MVDDDEGRRRLQRLAAAGATVLCCVVIGVLIYRSRRPEPIDHPYDDSAATAIDPDLVSHHQDATWPTGLDRPRALAARADGGLYVAGDRCVVHLAAEGDERARWVLDVEPTALALGSDGVLLVACGDHVRRLDGNGEEVDRWPPPAQGAWITAIGIAPATVYLADPANRTVWRCSRDGERLGRVRGSTGEQRGWLQPLPERNLDLAIADDGGPWITNPGRLRVERFGPDGHFREAVGVGGMAIDRFCGCHNPVALALVDGGLVTGEKGSPRVKVIAEDGALLGVVAGREGDFDGSDPIADLAVLADGRIAVLDRMRRAVRVFAAKRDGRTTVSPIDPPTESPGEP